MGEDKRKKQKPIPDDLENVLNDKQKATLREIQYLGWRLKFVRRPLFLEAVPVVYNARFDQIGVLDPDGNINLETGIEMRSSEPEQEQEQQPPAVTSWEEKRKGMAPVPDNLEELLNDKQLRALRQIETFGWQLHFVRRELFQEPVPGIISPDGGKVATLEQDGRINLMPEAAVRKDQPAEQAEPAPPVPASKGKQAG